ALYGAFCELKVAFDPEGLFNPGKIVHARPLTDNLRFGAGYETRKVDTAFDFADYGGMARAAEQCGGIGACRKRLSGTMCPSYMATRDEVDSTRARANALRLAIAGKLGPAGLADPALVPVLDLCLECKACQSECPTGVDMARLKAEFLHQTHLARGASPRARFLANAEKIAKWGTRLAPISNWLAQSAAARWLAERLLGLDRRRAPPRFARESFQQWWNARRRLDAADGTAQLQPGAVRAGEQPGAALFIDTFSNFYEPEILAATVSLAKRWGCSLTVLPRVCCGRPLISKGFLDEARKNAEAVTRALGPAAQAGLSIVFCEPSCFSAVRDDHPHLLRGELQRQARAVAEKCVTFEEWAMQATSSTEVRAGPSNILLHAHCHQKALVGSAAAAKLFSKIPGCAVTDLDSGCCGMAGSFGYEQEHYEISRAVGERRLLPAVRDRPEGALVVAPGFSCRHQIAHFTGVSAVHPAVLLAR
ncbi:MAG TPA: 4Fe-4S dicluster domain-containing protein, partial [Planctomycetaceae bacterium]|nr:4Fe-4S dicluster domain-containing protein [Planctomycetaceae bacterium]